MSSAIDRSNICDECPFGYSLSVHTAELDEPADDMSEIRLEMLRNEMENAARILNVAAGEIACRDTVKKKLPPRIAPEELPGSGWKLVRYVSKCPSFKKYAKLRKTDLA
jgi:hypothetical protein